MNEPTDDDTIDGAPEPDAGADEGADEEFVHPDAPPDTFVAGRARAAQHEEGEVVDDEPLAGDDSDTRPGLEKTPPYVLGLGPLKSAIESLIFVSDKPMTDKQLAEYAHASVAEVRMAAFELERDYQGRGIELHMVAGGYQFRSAAKNAPFVRVLVAPKPVRLSRALLETLSIVAYRQPVTRPEIDDVRGVDSGEALKALADRDLIRILGRKEEPGRPLLYGTTKHFLEFFGLNTLRDLPTLREYAELNDESRSIFERKMGEPLDLKGAQVQADEALSRAHAEMLDSDPDEDLDDDVDNDLAETQPDGEPSTSAIPRPASDPDPDPHDEEPPHEPGEPSEDEE